MNKSEYQRKTIDYYKLEQFVNGEWIIILDTDDFGEYQELRNKLFYKKLRGKKYRRAIESI